MAKGNKNDDGSNCQKYGVPLYGVAWLPSSVTINEDTDDAADSGSSAKIRHLVLAGGGGEGRSGIPNALLVSSFDFGANSLSDQPVAKHGTGSDLPYRIVVHPGGEGVICSFPESCRLFEWDSVTSEEKHTLSLKASEKRLEQLENVGQQLALTFHDEGKLLAVGGADGKLRVFKWPAMELVILDEANAHSSVKDLDFSPDGKFLVSVGGGHARVWNVATSTAIASLPKENDEIFVFGRFSLTSGADQVLYITAMQGKGGCIVKWNTTTWKRISSKYIVRDTISAFHVSSNGKFLAVGTTQGDISIVSSASMQVHTVIKKAHIGFVTALAFSPDSRALGSVSMDSSARVTLIEEKKDGTSLWKILFILLILAVLAFAVYPEKIEELLSLKLPFRN